jgi:hypothetical protein
MSIQDYENIALSDKQVLQLVPAHLVLYPDLTKYKTIDQVLGPETACLLLFEAKPNYGHWCCLFRTGNDIEFFNPYGGYPDDSLNYIPLHFREVSNQLVPYLSMLLIESPYNLSYNEHRFQKRSADIKTCGRHCAVRLAFRDLSLAAYSKLISTVGRKLHLDPDGVVTVLTAQLSDRKRDQI